MTFRNQTPSWIRTGPVLVLALALTACVSGTRSDPASDEATVTAPLYGLLEQDVEGYRFTRFSLDNRDAHRREEAWVDLKTLAPAFETGENECSVSLLNLVDSEIDLSLDGTQYLCLSDSPLFRASSIDAGDIVKNTAGNLVTQFSGMGVAGYYTSHFDRAAYQAAVRQAADRLDLGRFRAAVLGLLDQHRHRVTALDAQLAQARYRFLQDLRVTLDDRTDTFPQTPSQLRQGLSATLVDDGSAEIPRLFFDDPAQLATRLDNLYRGRLGRIRLRLDCSPLAGYAYRAEGCDRRLDYDALARYTGGEHYPVHYRIDLKNRVRFIPPIRDIRDRQLRVEGLADGRVIAYNLSDTLLRFESVSLYLNEDVDTQFILGQILEPGGEHPLPALPSFDNYEDQMTFDTIDAHTLGKTARYGLEITYIDTRTGVTHVLKKLFEHPYAEFEQAPF